MSQLYVRDTSGASDSKLLLSSPENKMVTDWSLDGRYIIYCSVSASSQMDVWALPTTGNPIPMPILATPFNECQGQVSPNGRWITYASDETDSWEVYIQAFPSGGSKRVVSVGGGSEPQWRGDGRELDYVASDGTLMSVQINVETGEPVRQPARLFRILIKAGELNTRRNHYIASSDGQRFLVNTADQERDTLGVLINWASILQ